MAQATPSLNADQPDWPPLDSRSAASGPISTSASHLHAGVNRATPGQSRAGRSRGGISGFQFFRI